MSHSTKTSALAARAFEELKKDGLIRSTMADLVDPENWCEITDAGRQALERGVLDDEGSARLAILLISGSRLQYRTYGQHYCLL